MSAESTQDLAVSDTPLRAAFQSNQALSAYRRDWELGRWDQLARIDYTACESDADAAFLALIVGSANQALGNLHRVRGCIDFAMARGCSRYTAIQVLTSGVQNLLGRARLAAGRDDAAVKQFRGAVELGARQGRDSLTAAARLEEARDQLGLRQSESGVDRQVANTAASIEQRDPDTRAPVILTYRHAPKELVESESAPFVLLDSKSLPRSGLHYMRKRFAEALGDRFSFCEWYQEPGCCGQRPCALTGFLSHRRSRYEPTIRLVKSHDFELDDPKYETSYSLRHVIITRDPLYILTSWFALDQIDAHQKQIASAGIDVTKIYYSHEPELIAAIYELLEDQFVPPADSVLRVWLQARSKYIREFRDKWVRADPAGSAYTHVVDYTQIDLFVRSTLEEIGELPRGGLMQSGGPQEEGADVTKFAPRRDPFSHQCKAIEAYLRMHADAFYEVAGNPRIVG